MIEYFCTDEQTRSLVKLDEESPVAGLRSLNQPRRAFADNERFGIEEDDVCAPSTSKRSPASSATTSTPCSSWTPPSTIRRPGKALHHHPYRHLRKRPDHVISVCSVYRVPLFSILKSRQRNSASHEQHQRASRAISSWPRRKRTSPLRAREPAPA